mgnify:CR=1 FL=1
MTGRASIFKKNLTKKAPRPWEESGLKGTNKRSRYGGCVPTDSHYTYFDLLCYLLLQLLYI